MFSRVWGVIKIFFILNLCACGEFLEAWLEKEKRKTENRKAVGKRRKKIHHAGISIYTYRFKRTSQPFQKLPIPQTSQIIHFQVFFQLTHTHTQVYNRYEFSILKKSFMMNPSDESTR